MEKLMTLEEVAEFLRLSKDTVYRMANTGKIPASKVGNQWRFDREEIDEWMKLQRPAATKGNKVGHS